MLGRLWPRFALEACFLIGVAVVAGLLDLSVVQIFAVMAVAYLATVVLEWTASHVRRAPKAAAAEAPAVAPGVEVADGVVAVTVHPSKSAWEREPEPEAEPEPEVEPELELEPEPAPEPEPEVEREPELGAEPEPELELELEPEPELKWSGSQNRGGA